MRTEARHHWIPPATAGMLSLLLVSCLSGYVWTLDYELTGAAFREDDRGTTPLDTAPPDRGADLACADGEVSFSIDVHPGGIDLEVTHRGAAPLRLGLDGALFVDPEGRELPLYAAGARNEGEAATEVPGGTTTALYLWPEAWLRQGHRRRAAWRADSPVDGTTIAEPERSEAERRGRAHLGRSFEILLPVESGGQPRTYRFLFTVAESIPKRISWA